MALSNKFGAIVLSTGNKSELGVGYCTLYGDMVGGLAVISDVPKTLVYRLSRYVNSPPSGHSPGHAGEAAIGGVAARIRKTATRCRLTKFSMPCSMITSKIRIPRSGSRPIMAFDIEVVRRVIRMVDRANTSANRPRPVSKFLPRLSAMAAVFRLPPRVRPEFPFCKYSDTSLS